MFQFRLPEFPNAQLPRGLLKDHACLFLLQIYFKSSIRYIHYWPCMSFLFVFFPSIHCFPFISCMNAVSCKCRFMSNVCFAWARMMYTLHLTNTTSCGLVKQDCLTHLTLSSALLSCLCSIYNQLKYCVDNWAYLSWCKGYRFLVDEVFLEVHEKYFLLCGQVHDPPLTTLIILIASTIIPTLFLPLLCLKLTTWNREMPSTLGLWCAELTKENCSIFQHILFVNI